MDINSSKCHTTDERSKGKGAFECRNKKGSETRRKKITIALSQPGVALNTYRRREYLWMPPFIRISFVLMCISWVPLHTLHTSIRSVKPTPPRKSETVDGSPKCIVSSTKRKIDGRRWWCLVAKLFAKLVIYFTIPSDVFSECFALLICFSVCVNEPLRLLYCCSIPNPNFGIQLLLWFSVRNVKIFYICTYITMTWFWMRVHVFIHNQFSMRFSLNDNHKRNKSEMGERE